MSYCKIKDKNWKKNIICFTYPQKKKKKEQTSIVK